MTELVVTPGQRLAVIVTFVVYTLLVLAVGWAAKRRMERVPVERYISEFYSGGRGLGTVAVAFLIAAGLCGVGTFVGGPGLAWKVGGVWLVLCASQVVATFVVLGEIGKKAAIVARRINANSFMDLIAHRFNHNPWVIGMGVASIVVFMTAYVVAQTIGGARVFETMTGLPYEAGLLIFMVSVLFVTVLGGIRGVAAATVVQGVAMTVAVLALLAGTHFEVQGLGGWEAACRLIASRDPSYFDLWKWDIPFEFSQWIIYGFAAISMPHLTMGALVYRNAAAMKKAIALGGVIVAFWTIGLVLFGTIAAKALFPGLAVPDHAVPLLTMHVLPPWLAGVTLAGVASAVQSTVAALVIVISSSVVLNFYCYFWGKGKRPEDIRKVSRAVTAVISIAALALALRPPELLQLIVTFGMGGMAAAFFTTLLLGAYWPRVNEQGAAAAMAGAFATYFFTHSALAKSLPFDITMGMHPVAVSMLVSTVLLVAVSLLTPRPPKGIIQVWFGRSYSPCATRNMRRGERP